MRCCVVDTARAFGHLEKKEFFAVAQRNFALCSLFKAVSDAREVGWGAALVLGEYMAGGEGAYDSPRRGRYPCKLYVQGALVSLLGNSVWLLLLASVV